MGCAYTRPLKVFSNKAKEDVLPREAERSREAVRPRPPPWVLSELLSLRGGNIRIYFKFVLMFFNTFSLPIPPRPRPDLVSQRTLGAEAMAELVSRQESYYANTGAEEPGYTKTP
jgi:hypothetical protein